MRRLKPRAPVVQALNEILAKARQVDELAAEVANASEQQTTGIAQINDAVGQMDKATQANAASAEETASVSTELNAQAGAMKASVAQLLKLVGGHTSGWEAQRSSDSSAAQLSSRTYRGNGHTAKSEFRNDAACETIRG